MTCAIDKDVGYERRYVQATANKWGSMFTHSQIYLLKQAAEKHFRSKLQKQFKKATILVESSDSDEEVTIVSHNQL